VSFEIGYLGDFVLIIRPPLVIQVRCRPPYCRAFTPDHSSFAPKSMRTNPNIARRRRRRRRRRRQNRLPTPLHVRICSNADLQRDRSVVLAARYPTRRKSTVVIANLSCAQFHFRCVLCKICLFSLRFMYRRKTAGRRGPDRIGRASRRPQQR
jgi:hypothetical protein